MKWTLLVNVIGFASIGGMVWAEAPATQPTFDEQGFYNESLVEAVRAKTKELRAAAATQPSHPYAGSYFQGDGLGANLTLDVGPTGKYTFTWHGCLGLYHLNYGTVAFDGTGLTFHPRLETRAGERMRIDLDLHVVRWGERTYLIAPREFDTFVEFINEGFEPRGETRGVVYLRQGDEKLPVAGNPDLPAQHAAALAPLLTAFVTDVGPEQVQKSAHPPYSTRKVTLNVGRRDGVATRDKFVTLANGVLLHAFVTEVSDESCVASVGAQRDYLKVAVGDEFFTRVRR